MGGWVRSLPGPSHTSPPPPPRMGMGGWWGWQGVLRVVLVGGSLRAGQQRRVGCKGRQVGRNVAYVPESQDCTLGFASCLEETSCVRFAPQVAPQVAGGPPAHPPT